MQTHFKNWLMGATIILFASCNKPNTQGKYIPREAAFVVQINGKNLSTKLPWNDVKQNPLFKDAELDNSIPTAMKQALNNPDSSGIDVNADLVFFALKDSMGGYIAFEGSVKNEKLFNTFNTQLNDSTKQVTKDGVTFITKKSFCAGYTKDKFVYIFDAPQMQNASEKKQDTSRLSVGKFRDVTSTCQEIFKLDEDISLARNERFSKMLKENGDIHFWINGESLMTGVSGNPMMAMIDVGKFYKGSIITSTINFENGKILMDVKGFVEDDFAKIYKKYSGGKVSDDMLKRLPGKDIAAVLALNFNPEVIREFLKMMSMDGVVNMGLAKVGFTLDDFIKANKGDILIGASDLKFKKDSSKNNNGKKDETSANIKPDFKYVFASSIANKDAFNKLINAGKKLGAEKLSDSSKAQFAYKSDGTYFTFSNTQDNADKFIAGTNSNIDFVNKINGQPFGAYINIHSFLTAFFNPDNIKDSSDKALYDASIKLWDNVYIKGGAINSDDAITQTVEINMVDKTTSSLKQLNTYAVQLAEIYKIKRAKNKMSETTFDPTLAVPDSTKHAAAKAKKNR